MPRGRPYRSWRREVVVGVFIIVNGAFFWTNHNKPKEPCTLRGVEPQLREQQPCTPCPSAASSSKRRRRRTVGDDDELVHPKRQTRRTWSGDVRCAFVTLVRQGIDATRYAGFLESSSRLRRTFRLEREYPHVVFHEKGFPDDHKSVMLLTAPWLQFVDISHVWGNAQRPPKELWNATDRSEGYRHMCRFYGLQIFNVSKQLGIDVIFRVDDDVFMLRKVDYDPFRLLWESGAVYGFGGVTTENHEHTATTFEPWVKRYCSQRLQIDMDDLADDDDESRRKKQRLDCDGIARSVVDRMYFNNVFMSVVSFWSENPLVSAFAGAIDKSNGIYVHRWGDAPMQTATVRLFAAGSSGDGVFFESAKQLPRLHYVHFSTDNLILDGAVTCLSCDGGSSYFSKLSAEPITRRKKTALTHVLEEAEEHPFHQPLGKSVVGIDEIVNKAIKLHRETFINDIVSAGIAREWSGSSLDNLPIFALLQLVEKVGAWCDNVGFVNVHILLPIHCCCHLDVIRDDETNQAAALAVLYKTLEPWMNSALFSFDGSTGKKKKSFDWLASRIQQDWRGAAQSQGEPSSSSSDSSSSSSSETTVAEKKKTETPPVLQADTARSRTPGDGPGIDPSTPPDPNPNPTDRANRETS